MVQFAILFSMKTKILSFIVTLFAITANFKVQAELPTLFVNNRILLKLNGKTITVMDLVKKMDLIFYRQFPHYRGNDEARYQFYMANWRPIFVGLVNDQLILADAVDKEIEITDGDIRETLEDLFGPDVVMNLDKMGLTFDEAWELLKSELIVQRMNQMMIRSRAITEVNPKEVKKVYDEWLLKNPPQPEWLYQVITVESNDPVKAESVAEKAYCFLEKEKKSVQELPSLLSQEGVSVRVSDEFRRSDKELSPIHKEALALLSAGNYSFPSLTKGRKDEKTALRIFALKEKSEGKKVSLKEMEEKIRGELIKKSTEKYTTSYLEKLRLQYGITEEYLSQTIPSSFEPFVMR